MLFWALEEPILRRFPHWGPDECARNSLWTLATSHAIACNLMIAIAISVGPHCPYLGRCDRCRIDHFNCAIICMVMEHQRDHSITMRFAQLHHACYKSTCSFALASFTVDVLDDSLTFLIAPPHYLKHPQRSTQCS